MKKQLLTVFLLSLCFYSDGQVTFQKTYGGTGGDEVYSVQQTTDGGYIITGYTASFSAGYAVYLLKTDANGNAVWKKAFGGTGDIGYSVQQTSDGGYIIAGQSLSLGIGSYEVYLIKTDTNGNLLWSKKFGGTSYDLGASVQQTTDGGFVIAGNTYSFGAGGYDVYLIKTDSNGNSLWTKTFGGTADDDAWSVQQTMDGGYVIVGTTYSFGAGVADIYLIKTDSIGDTLWTKTFGGIDDDLGNSIHQTSDGGYIISGTTLSFGAGNLDDYLLKTDSIGNLLWPRTFGGIGDDVGNSVQQTVNGGYIISGYSLSFGSGSYDIYLIKTDTNGDSLWTKTFGGTNDDRGNSVEQTTDSGFIIAGRSLSFGSGVSDVYLIKTDSLGNSGCHQSNPATIVTTPATIVTNPATIVTSPATIVTSPATLVGSGGIVTTLCTTVGINEIANFQFPISISPNPSSGNSTITFPENFQKGKIEIYTVLGEKIYNEKINGENKKEIHLKNISAGIYFVKVWDGEKVHAEKLVIE